jgi:galactose mutarotase-like enzyme
MPLLCNDLLSILLVLSPNRKTSSYLLPMFTIKSAQDLYLTYTLTDGTQSVQVVPERGGIVTSWSIGGNELFYLDRERFTDPQLSVRGGIPILFPICGNLPDDAYTVAGRQYKLKQHGFARDLPWQVVAQSATEQGASLTVALVSTPETLAVYPFEFRVELEYVLTNQQLEIRQRVTNQGSQIMPFSIGYHPYFAATDKPGLKIDIPSTECFLKTGESQPYHGSFDFGGGEIDLAFSNLSRSAASVTSANGQQITTSWDYPHGHVVFWTVPDKDFYCLEPWTGLRNAINTGKDLITVASGETWNHAITLTIS